MQSSLRKRAVRTKAMKDRGSSPGDSLPENESGREIACDVNVGLKTSYTTSDEGTNLDEE